MTDRSEVINQTNLAFDFIQKLYIEVSYLVKEVAGILREEDERFIIGRPAGYSITTRSSTGLEPANVKLWVLRKFAVFFVPEDVTNQERGQTKTTIDKDLRVLYLRILLNDKTIKEPVIYSGVLRSIEKTRQVKWPEKFEHIMGHIEYNDDKVFKDTEKVNYKDAYIELQGELIKNNLFEINDSEAILNRLIKPSLELYRKR